MNTRFWGYADPFGRPHDLGEVEPDPLAVVGHEVRNLIATFVGFSELLLSQDWPRDRQREYLETMRDEGMRVSQFLNELLDLQRMELGAAGIKPKPTDLASLLRFAADVAAHDPRHPVTLELQDKLPLAMAEPDRIQQVLANLLSNARKYSPQGGPVRITSRRLNGSVEVCVQDAGIGIPSYALERVFEKFYRVSSVLHRDVRGTGIGLAICRQIIEAHGGRIWAESGGLGQGARLCFELPVAIQPTARRERSRRATRRDAHTVGAPVSKMTLAPLNRLDARHAVRGPHPLPDARLLVP